MLLFVEFNGCLGGLQRLMVWTVWGHTWGAYCL